MEMVCRGSSVVERTLGKGEVESPILSRGTISANPDSNKLSHFLFHRALLPLRWRVWTLP